MDYYADIVKPTLHGSYLVASVNKKHKFYTNIFSSDGHEKLDCNTHESH